MEKFYIKTREIIGSKKFFYAVVGLFILGATWLALSAKFPMAFDEDYHYGIIQQYAHQWSPFFFHQPAGSETLGDITRYPSYLYHYLLSFLYRYLSLFTGSNVIKIIILRLVNVAFFASGIVLFKKLLQKCKLSAALSNLALLLFILTPVVSQLAAQINYDNLLFPLTALSFLWTIDFLQSLKNGTVNTKPAVQLVIVCLLTSLVKYTFLPVFLAIVLFTNLFTWHYSRQHASNVFKSAWQGFRQINKLRQVVLIVLLVLSMGLFVERYGVNFVKYKTPAPDCDDVLSTTSCLNYGPYQRDYKLVLGKYIGASWGPARYSGHWLAQSMHELFFSIDSNYTEQSPFRLPYYTAWIVGGIGSLLLLLNLNTLRRNLPLSLFLFVSLIYVAVLWLNNYKEFTAVNWPVAIHGRYLVSLLIPLYILLAYSFSWSMQYLGRMGRYARPILALVCVFMLLQGGGFLTYILRSSDNGYWYWNNSKVKSFNLTTQKVLTKIIF